MLVKNFRGCPRGLASVCVGVGLVLLLGLSLVSYKSYQDRLRYEESLHRLSGEVETVLASQKELEEELTKSREQAAVYRQRTDTLLQQLREERKRLDFQIKELKRISQEREQDTTLIEARLTTAQRQIRSLENAAAAGERIIQKYSPGVAFIETTYTFEDKAGRRLRYASLNSSGAPSRDSQGPQVSIDGKGAVANLHSSGTGFLVKDGELITNRHVAEPWWAKEGIKNYAKFGFRPVRTSFRAFFPGLQGPFSLTSYRISARADLALVRFDPRGAKIPVLALDRIGTDAVVGRPVILLGYPAGIRGLVARADADTLRTVAGGQGIVESTRITEALSRADRIQPLITWGHLSAVEPHQLTYDALTTGGGSGGPVISAHGRVVGVNYAVQKSFAGSNFGVPIRFALELMD